MLVINPVVRDARVLKEAASLAQAGYEVTIIGRDDADHPPCDMVHPGGMRIIRTCVPGLLGTWAHTTAAKILWAVVGCLAVAGVLTFVYFTLTHLFLSPEQHAASIILLAGLICVTSVLWIFRRPAGLWVLHHLPNRAEMWMRLRKHSIGLSLQHWCVRQASQNVLKELNPDIVHCHDLPTLPIGVAWKRYSGGRVVFDSHEIFAETAHNVMTMRKRWQNLQQRLSPHVDGFITINDSIAEYLQAQCPQLPPAVVVMNATKRETAPSPNDGRLHHACFDAGASEDVYNKKILLYQGAFARHRGLEQTVRAGALLPEDWILVMMGWGYCEQELRNLAAEVDPRGLKIHFLPGVPQAELVRWTSGATAGIIAYENICRNHWFCTPNKLWEYPAAGVPILASPFPEIRKIVEGYDVGWLLGDPVTPENIAEVVRKIDLEDLARKQQNCRTFIEADNWSVYEKRLVEFYRRLQSIHAPATSTACA
jgi:glycosyltransferase involved in cell wall biosynthesis